MADESIIANLKSEGIKELITDLSGASKGFSLLDKSIAEAQKKLTTLDQSSQEFKDLTKEINAASTAMEAFNQDTGTLKKELRDTTNEIGNLERSLKELEKTGQKNTQVYKDLSAKQDELKKKAGQLKDTVSDLNAEIKNSGSDTKNLDKALRAINTVAAGYQAAQGALVLFGGENKKFEQTLLKLNAVMAITQGLQQIQNELSKKDSLFTQAAAKAKQLYIAVTTTATGAVNGLRVAILSLGAGIVIATLAAIAYNWDKISRAIGGAGTKFQDYIDKYALLVKGSKAALDSFDLEEKKLKLIGVSEEKILLLREQKIKQVIRGLKLQLLADEQGLKSAIESNAKLTALKTFNGGVGLLASLFLTTDSDLKKLQESNETLKKDIEKYEGDLLDIQLAFKKKKKDADKKDSSERIKDLKIIAANLKEQIVEIFSDDIDLFPEKAQDRSIKYFNDIISSLERVIQNVEIGSERYIYLNNQIEKTKKLLEQISVTEEQLTEQYKKSTDSIIKGALKEQDVKNKKFFENLEVSKQISEEEIELEKQKKQDKIDIALATGNALFSIAQGISDFRKQSLDNELASGIISEKKYQEELRKIKRQEAIANKAQAAFNISITIAEAIVKALAAGPVVGQVLAGITAALGFAQLALVLATPLPKFKKGGQVSEKLGLIKGKSHSQGGVPIEVEGEEYVMPVEETRKNIKALKAIHEGKFDKLFVPRENLIQPDIFANIPNPANIDSSILIDKEDYSSINSRLDKVASELYWLTNETKKGNKSRERGTEKVVKTLQNKSKRYV